MAVCTFSSIHVTLVRREVILKLQGLLHSIVRASLRKVHYPIQLSKGGGPKVSNLKTSAWQRRSIARWNSGVECKSRWSNAICLVTLNAASHVILSVLSNSIELPCFMGQ